MPEKVSITKSKLDNLAEAIAAVSETGVPKTIDEMEQTVLGMKPPILQEKSAYPTESVVTVTPDTGYAGLSQVNVLPISPTNVGSGVPRKYASTYTPGTTNQAIASGQYLEGVQTIKGDANLLPQNIASGVSIFGVQGTHGGGGGDTGQLAGLIQRTISGTVSDGSVSYVGAYVFASCSRLGSVAFPEATAIGSYAFDNCYSLSHVSIPKCTSVSNYAFQYCSKLMEIDLPLCTSIGLYVFRMCSELSAVNLPVCSTVSTGAFANCTKLETISAPSLASIGGSAFMSCNKLKSINFPQVTSVPKSAFYWCSGMSTVSLPECSIVDIGAFAYCSQLESISLPKCTNISASAFGFCSSLSYASFPVCTKISNSAFYGCSKLSELYLPSIDAVYSLAFGGCRSLPSVKFDLAGYIYSGAFKYCRPMSDARFSIVSVIESTAFSDCYNLISLYLGASSVCTLRNTNAFTSTPIAGYVTYTGGVYGSIYVPSSLYSAYISAANWSRFSSRFVSVDDGGGAAEDYEIQTTFTGTNLEADGETDNYEATIDKSEVAQAMRDGRTVYLLVRNSVALNTARVPLSNYANAPNDMENGTYSLYRYNVTSSYNPGDNYRAEMTLGIVGSTMQIGIYVYMETSQ